MSPSKKASPAKAGASGKGMRRRGSGGVFPVREDVWRVDIEVARDPVSGKRRRVSRYVQGTREGAELALARLKVADHEKRLPPRGTSARSVAAVFQAYQQAIDSGLVELAPSTRMTVRSAMRTMSATVLPDGHEFGSVRLSRLTWQDIEYMYAGMKSAGHGADWVRRCATVLSRALDLARKRGLIDGNPSKDAARPRSTRTKPFSPGADELRAVLKSAVRTDPEVADAATILASTGMRKGEILGLRWSEIDLRADEVHVGAATYSNGNVDVMRFPIDGFAAEPYVLVGNAIFREVLGYYTTQTTGDNLCGAGFGTYTTTFMGEHCGSLQLINFNFVADGVSTPHTNCFLQRTYGGDSGGPVYKPDNGNAWAYGTTVGSHKQSGQYYWCYGTIADVLSAMNGYLVHGI